MGATNGLLQGSGSDVEEREERLRVRLRRTGAKLSYGHAGAMAHALTNSADLYKIRFCTKGGEVLRKAHPLTTSS